MTLLLAGVARRLRLGVGYAVTGLLLRFFGLTAVCWLAELAVLLEFFKPAACCP